MTTDLRIDLGSEEAVCWALERELWRPTEVLRLSFDGEPVSKGRARFTTRGGKPHPYTPERTRAAELRIGLLARQRVPSPAGPEQTFGVFAKFFSETWQRRDVDNMLKLVCDSLTGIVWEDDSQVSEMSAAVRRGEQDPRTHVLIYKTNAPTPPMEPCRTCGKAVRQYKSQANRYCSRECSALAQRKRVDLTCSVCTSVYQLSISRAALVTVPFCSDPCRRLGRRVDGPCMQCGVLVSRPRSQTYRKMFCSNTCANTYKVGRPRGGGPA